MTRRPRLRSLPPALVPVVLRSERVRTAAAVAVIVLGAALLLVVSRALRVEADVVPAAVAAVLGGLALLVAFEVAVHVRIRRHLRSGAAPPSWVWAVSGLVEVTVPTAALVLAGRVLDVPADALGSPVALLYFPLLALSVLRLNPGLSAALGVAASAQYAAVALYLHAASPAGTGGPFGLASHAAVAVEILMTGAACAVVAWDVRRRAEEAVASAEERERLRTLFGQHTAPSIVRALLDGGDALDRGRRQHVVAMFLDVRGFTAFAEAREPEEVVAYLNALFEIAVAAVTERGGVVHQLLGDGLLALFGVPEARDGDADRAVEAALATVAAVERAVEEGTLPPTRLGIGLHAGEGLVGLVGPTARREYKVVGDAVNVASRVEQLNKTYGSTLLATAEVVEALRHDVPAVDLGRSEVRGRAQPVHLYRLV